jgi:hypothetical protein
MEKEIVYTNDYALLLSDDKPTTWYYDSYSKKVMHTGGAEYGDNPITKSIIAHRPLPNSGYAIIKGVPLLPPLPQGDNVEELAKHRFRKSDYEIQLREEAYIAGYNEAKEKYKYTEEDLRVAISLTRDGVSGADEIIQSLQQPSRPSHFECEMVRLSSNESFGLDYGSSNLKPKTITNSQGQVELVGKYI